MDYSRLTSLTLLSPEPLTACGGEDLQMPQTHHLQAAAHYIGSWSSSENWVFLLTSAAILASDNMAFMKIKRNKCNTVPGPLAPLEAVCAEVAEDQM